MSAIVGAVRAPVLARRGRAASAWEGLRGAGVAGMRGSAVRLSHATGGRSFARVRVPLHRKMGSQRSRLQVQAKDGDDDDDMNKDWEDWLGDRNRGSGIDWEDRVSPVRPKFGGVPRDRFLKADPDFFEKLDPNLEERESTLRMEARVNRWESRAALRYLALLVVFPLLVSAVVKHNIAQPILLQWEGLRPEAFALTDSEKVELAKELHEDEMRMNFEASIGKAPPLGEDELYRILAEEAKRLKQEGMEENREALENVIADSSAGLTIFSILVTNRSIIVVLRRTLDRIFSGLSDTGKAFMIILVTDVLLGFHSEAGWQTLLNMGAAHYGIEADATMTTLFISTVPVTMDAVFKFWVFRYLNRISPTATVTFRAMNRH